MFFRGKMEKFRKISLNLFFCFFFFKEKKKKKKDTTKTLRATPGNTPGQLPSANSRSSSRGLTPVEPSPPPLRHTEGTVSKRAEKVTI